MLHAPTCYGAEAKVRHRHRGGMTGGMTTDMVFSIVVAIDMGMEAGIVIGMVASTIAGMTAGRALGSTSGGVWCQASTGPKNDSSLIGWRLCHSSCKPPRPSHGSSTGSQGSCTSIT